MRRDDIVRQAKRSSRRSKKPKKADRFLFCPTGSTLLNLALSDKVDGGYPAGRMVNVIGDPSAGKSILGLTQLAVAANMQKFDKYRLVQDETEAADGFDKEYLFGKKLCERLVPPLGLKDDTRSATVEQFVGCIHSELRASTSFMYILDSFDAIGSEEDIKKLEAKLRAAQKGKKEKGSYGMSKPKSLHEMFKAFVREIKKQESFLTIISQTRENINADFWEPKKRRSGGAALHFYATHEIWLAIGKAIKKKNLIIGHEIVVSITKNKITGKKRTVRFPIYYDLGVDDVASCVDYLVDVEHWKKSGTKIKAVELGLTFQRDALIRKIEQKNMEPKLRKLVGEVWNDIEDSIKLSNRKRRF